MLNARPQPTPEEHRVLASRSSLEAEMNGAGWRLRDRELRGRTFEGMTWRNTAWVDVDFVLGDLTSCKLENVTFEGVTFEDSSWQGVTADGVTFTRCTFTNVELEDTKLVNCAFRACRFERCRVGRCALEGCHFEDHAEENGMWDETALERVSFARAELRNVSMGRGRLERIDVRGGQVQMSWSDTVARDVVVREVEIQSLEMDHARVETLVLERVRGSTVRIADSRLDGLELRRCEGLEELTAVGSQLGRLKIEDCSQMSSAALLGCEVADVVVLRSSLVLLSLRETRVTTSAQVTSSVLDGVVLQGCQVEDLTLRDSEIASRLDVSGTTFVRLVTSGMRYRKDAKLVDTGTQYRECPPLPRPV